MNDGLYSRACLAAAAMIATAALTACAQPVVPESTAGITDTTIPVAGPAWPAQAQGADRRAWQAESEGAKSEATALDADQPRQWVRGAAAGSAAPSSMTGGGTPDRSAGGSALLPGRYLAENVDFGEFTTTTSDIDGEDLTLATAFSGDKAKPAKSAQCAAFEKDLDADLGEVLRAGCQPSLAQMSALMDNPLGNVAMLFTQVDLYRMENPLNGKTANKWNYMGIAQFPKAINKDWNLINRVVWNVPSMPLDQDKIDNAADRAQRLISSGNQGAVVPPGIGGAAPIDVFDGRTTSFGDMYYNGLLAPKKGIDMGAGKFLWGAGIDVGVPTATEDILGTGKWLAGPSALGVYMGPKWKVGALVQHFWDFAGDDDRDDVNLTNLQYFIFYSLDETTSIGAAPNIIANWEQDSDNAFTVPIGIGISKTVQFGKVPVRFGIEAHYSVIKPNDLVGSEWDFRFYVIPAAPSALFEWMTKPLF